MFIFSKSWFISSITLWLLDRAKTARSLQSRDHLRPHCTPPLGLFSPGRSLIMSSMLRIVILVFWCYLWPCWYSVIRLLKVLVPLQTNLWLAIILEITSHASLMGWHPSRQKGVKMPDHASGFACQALQTFKILFAIWWFRWFKLHWNLFSKWVYGFWLTGMNTQYMEALEISLKTVQVEERGIKVHSDLLWWGSLSQFYSAS